VVAIVEPGERTAAAAYTNTARYVARPLGPLIAGAMEQVALGLPFVLAGLIKAGYDLTLWSWFRRVPLVDASTENVGRGDAPPTSVRRFPRGATLR
jgi:hypothetical protein